MSPRKRNPTEGSPGQAAPEEQTSSGASTAEHAEVESKDESGTAQAPLHPLLGGSGPEPATAGGDGDRIWAVIAHGSALLTVLFGWVTSGAVCVIGPLVPLVIWLVFRQRSGYVSRQALQATIFQALVVVVTVLLAVLGGFILAGVWAASLALVQVIVGICLIPVALLLTLAYLLIVLGLPVAALVYAIYAAYEVGQGRDFRYWLVGDWVH